MRYCSKMCSAEAAYTKGKQLSMKETTVKSGIQFSKYIHGMNITLTTTSHTILRPDFSLFALKLIRI